MNKLVCYDALINESKLIVYYIFLVWKNNERGNGTITILWNNNTTANYMKYIPLEFEP